MVTGVERCGAGGRKAQYLRREERALKKQDQDPVRMKGGVLMQFLSPDGICLLREGASHGGWWNQLSLASSAGYGGSIFAS